MSIKFDLLLPFLQRKPIRDLVKQKPAEILSQVTDPEAAGRVHLSDETHVASKKVPIYDRISVCANPEGDFSDAGSLNLREGIAGKSYVFCEDDCKAKDLTCDADGLEGETKSFADITDGELYDVQEFRDEDYQQWEEELEGDEAEGGLQGRQTAVPWSSDRCESFSSLSEAEEDPPDTTDPYLSHKLNIPYSRTLRPRYFKSHGEAAEYTTTILPRRPRSPVRKILPGKFDLRGIHEEWKRQRRITETRRSLRESKDRITQSIKQLASDQLEGDKLISSVVLQALLEEVTLTVMGVKIVTDVHTFVNMAVILALTELNLFSGDMLTDEQSRLFIGLGILDERIKVNGIDEMETSGMRKTLLGAYRAPYSRNVDTTLHRRLPWPYMSPSHQRGHTKFYPNVRERIDEHEPKVNGEDVSPSYVPDLKCFHLREVLDKSYVAYKRESKYLAPPSGSIKLLENLFLRLVSFI